MAIAVVPAIVTKTSIFAPTPKPEAAGIDIETSNVFVATEEIADTLASAMASVKLEPPEAIRAETAAIAIAKLISKAPDAATDEAAATDTTLTNSAIALVLKPALARMEIA